MDILFISHRGSMYRYFVYLNRELPSNTKVVDFFPKFLIGDKAPALLAADVAQGIAFQLQRKRSKYTAPEWVWTLIQSYYEGQYLRYYRRFYSLLNKYQPKCIALWNGHRLPEFAIKHLAQQLNIPVVHFENGLLPNTTTFDLSGVNDANSLPREASFYKAQAAIERSTPIAQRNLVTRKFHRSKKSRAKSHIFHKSLPEKFIFVPFQVKFDSQVLLNSPRIKTMYELYRWIEYAMQQSNDRDLKFVIKEHPSDPHKYSELYDKNPQIIFSNRDTKELIEQSEAVITINSSVGIEALLLHKSVIVLGEACFGIQGLTHPLSSMEQLPIVINQLSGSQPDTILIEQFLSYLEHQYSVRGSWRNPNSMHVQALTEKFTSVIGTPVGHW